MKRAILWGGTGQARVLDECLSHAGIEVVAVFDNADVAPPLPGVPLLQGWAAFEAWATATDQLGDVGFLVAIGGSRGRDRMSIQSELVRRGLRALTIAHPTAYVASNAVIAEGSQILAKAGVCVEARLGRGCIINTAATVDHECVLGDGVHICPGAHLAGCVVVGDYAMVGTGAAVLPRVRIGDGAIVGAGAVVVRDVAPGAVVVGNPARAVQR